MSIIVFYSWQKDSPPSTNRNFIQSALEKAIKELNRDKEIILDVRLEKDTEGVAGSPDIAHTIFDKISNSHIFVGDVSIINSDENPKRLTPNPNVLVELGFAARHLDWDRIICVFNTAYGTIENLPFDLRPRRILPYKATTEEGDKNFLKSQLQVSIQAIISHSENLLINSRIKVIQSLINELEYNLVVSEKTDGSNFSPFETARFSTTVDQGLRSLISSETYRKINEVYFLLKQTNRFIDNLSGNPDRDYQTTIRILEIAKKILPSKIQEILLDLAGNS